MKGAILNSGILENSMQNDESSEIDKMIWHIIFMIIMKDKMMEIKFIRKWKFGTRNRQNIQNNLRSEIVRINQNDSDDSDDSDYQEQTGLFANKLYLYFSCLAKRVVNNARKCLTI